MWEGVIFIEIVTKTIPILEVDGDCERNDKSTSASHRL